MKRKPRRRSNIDIMANILEIAMDWAKITWIVYKANLNFTIIKQYLADLMEKNLMTQEGRFFQTTDRGVEFLEEYQRITRY